MKSWRQDADIYLTLALQKNNNKLILKIYENQK